MTTAEITAAGIPAARLRTLVRQGTVLPLGRGVYARAELVARIDAGQERRRALRVAAAVAIAGPEAVASHHDAALIHGLAQLDRPPAMIALSRPPGTAGSRTGRPGVRIYSAPLPAAHLTARHGVPLTSVARTVVDLARTRSLRSGVVVADSALHARQTTKAELRAVIGTCARWPGIERARQVVAFSDERSESPFESISRLAFHASGLPPAELQVVVGADGIVIGRVDFLWREHATIAEADGAAKYSDPVRARMQLERDALLRQAGFEVVHFLWRDLLINPDQVVEWIRAAFRRSAALREWEDSGKSSPRARAARRRPER